MSLIVLTLISILAYIIPVVVVAKSKRTSGNEKFLWLILVILFSWISFLAFLLAAPIKKSDSI
jgi:multidrug transporter EmrE-like cation transporter